MDCITISLAPTGSMRFGSCRPEQQLSVTALCVILKVSGVGVVKPMTYVGYIVTSTHLAFSCWFCAFIRHTFKDIYIL